MMNLKESVEFLKKSALQPEKTIRRTLESAGKEGAGCFPVYTPEEIVYAAGFIPIGMWGGRTEIRKADKYLQGFCCSIMRTDLELGLRGKYDFLRFVIIPTFCDTLKCVCENWKVAVPRIPLIPVVYPQNRLINAGITYMNEEFLRVKEEIEAVTGTEITDQALEESFSVYESYRETMRAFTDIASDHCDIIDSSARHLIIKAAYFMDKKEYTAVVRRIVDELRKLPPVTEGTHRVVITGLHTEPAEILEILDENNISVVGDDLAQESRQFRTRARKQGTAIERMTYRIVDQRGDTFLYEDQKTKGEMLVDMAKEKNAEGIIVFMMKFCDPEEFDYPIVKRIVEDAEIPLLYVEIEEQMDSFEQLRTRIQSFMEMLDR